MHPEQPPMPPMHAAMMQQIAHLPPSQQQAMLAQMQRQQQSVQLQMTALNQRGPPPPRQGHQNQRQEIQQIQLPHRVSERMNGSELQLIIRNQAMQVQMNDPVLDDFYHHFWVMKGGRSKVGALKPATSTTSTERKTLNNEQIGASLGSGTVVSRSAAQAVRAPKPLIAVAAEEAAEPSEAAEATDDSSGPPIRAQRWHVRERIEVARETLIELRVHASSAAVMTPNGQMRRNGLLQRLFELVQGAPLDGQGAAEPEQAAQLMQCEKGQKLLADLLPLWPPPMAFSILSVFIEHLPEWLSASRGEPVRAFSSCLAAVPKSLPAEQPAVLLAAISAHGASLLKRALQRQEMSALLLGLLCHPNLSSSEAAQVLGAFYGALMGAACTSEAAWTVLDALLDANVDAGHRAVLGAAVGVLDTNLVTSEACKSKLEAFAQRLLAMQ